MCNPIRDDGSSQSDMVRKEKKPYFQRYWTSADIARALTVTTVHFWCLLAPFNYKWEALRFGLILAAGDPLDWVSIHRFHHQFSDTDRDPHSPKEGLLFSHIMWIFDTLYIKDKCGGRNNVMDLKKQWFYRFLRKTIGLQVLMYWTVLYFYGGLPYLTCGGGVGGVLGYHVTWLVASVGHTWGSRPWKTNDTSHNVWWLSLVTMGDSWHNNHHAFEWSARQGLEWWQIDITWYLIRLFEVLGLATDVKLPSESQKQKLALAR
ncbi:hypothetical protein DY000_02044568 [Brassica cretica]|uniref:Fatty acid desaturase domain-containing protein n=1 Tax=Brassica cretica TaxID=69181 RepID=A0ABQ7EZ72_BRACR|nr:hypothetical protein DY000_02044568 [Brassica cretica]